MNLRMRSLHFGAFHEAAPALIGTWSGWPIGPFVIQGFFAAGQSPKPTATLLEFQYGSNP